MVPTAVVTLLHVPDGVGLPNVVVAFWHTLSEPVIAPGLSLTVTVVVVMQPPGKV